MNVPFTGKYCYRGVASYTWHDKNMWKQFQSPCFNLIHDRTLPNLFNLSIKLTSMIIACKFFDILSFLIVSLAFCSLRPMLVKSGSNSSAMLVKFN